VIGALPSGLSHVRDPWIRRRDRGEAFESPLVLGVAAMVPGYAGLTSSSGGRAPDC